MTRIIHKECSFCKKCTKLTREHLWPQALHGRMKKVNQLNESAMWVSKVQEKLLKSEPAIKDVCEICNNGVLSQLDNYICKLFDANFKEIYEEKSIVSFDYNYHMLQRWLLKMCFNSARVNNSLDKNNLSRFVEYILGLETNSATYVQLFLQMTYPQEIPQCDLPFHLKSEKSYILDPKINRVGFMQFKTNFGAKLLRAIHLRSFSFYLAFWNDESINEKQDFADIFCRSIYGMEIVDPSRTNLKTFCVGIGAWDSIKHSLSKFEQNN